MLIANFSGRLGDFAHLAQRFRTLDTLVWDGDFGRPWRSLGRVRWNYEQRSDIAVEGKTCWKATNEDLVSPMLSKAGSPLTLTHFNFSSELLVREAVFKLLHVHSFCSMQHPGLLIDSPETRDLMLTRARIVAWIV